MTFIPFVHHVLLAAVGLAGQLAPQADRLGDPPSAWDVAITIDDVPMSGGGSCTAPDLREVTAALLRALRQASVTATAFVVPGTSCQGTGALGSLSIARQWREAGHAVGNHSWSHRDYNGVSATVYLRDAARADEALSPLLRATDQAERWYRPPLLHTGPTARKQQALAAWLERTGHRMGVVTIDNQEWVFAAAYARAREAGNDRLMARVVASYLAHLEQSVVYYRDLARSLFNREVPQVLLLHANRLNADHLDRVLAMLSASGARFVPMREAVTDPAYLRPDTYVGPRGLSWLQLWAIAEGIPVSAEPRQPAWIDTVAAGG